ncbi:MAG: hypothetical protein H0X24_19730 [Ktedonobacterales bacterium]|nr:hypothetical protein [Ktedonobacterales bacterium]
MTDQQRDWIAKTDLLTRLIAETGKSRHLIEKVMTRLEALGQIHPYPDPVDGRRVRVPLEDLERIRQAVQE